jgi:hypothetical protein
MRRPDSSRTVSALLATALLLAGITANASASEGGDASAALPGTTAGEELWIARFDGGLENDDRAVAAATSAAVSVRRAGGPRPFAD